MFVMKASRIPYYVAKLGLLFLFPVWTFAQPAMIRGVVTDEYGGAPLPGVNVYLEGTTLGDATAPNGTYTIENIPPGGYTLIAKSLGFEAYQHEIELENGETLEQFIALAEQPLEIAEIVVERWRLTGGRSGVLGIPGAAHYIDAHAEQDVQVDAFDDLVFWNRRRRVACAG